MSAEHRTVTRPAPWDERCAAILDYVYGWRCTRRASQTTGLCSQHGHFGARVPDGWDHKVNEHGVDVPRIRGSVCRVPGDYQARVRLT